jgi:hypothetical protein
MISNVKFDAAGGKSVTAVIDGVVMMNIRLDVDGHYQNLLKQWIAADNAPAAYVQPPAPAPQAVSRMQAMVALSRAGLLTPVQNWVASQDAETQLVWNNAPEFSRGSALLASAATSLGLSADQVDALFTTAAAISP